MEPDLIGQEKQPTVCPAASHGSPQWSLTSSVRKSLGSGMPHNEAAINPQWSLTSSVRKRERQDSADDKGIRPAMEPDLIGQEKLKVLARRDHAIFPAMEPDLIGQEKSGLACRTMRRL